MKVVTASEDCVELNLTDEEFSLITSTNIGMKFWVSGKIISQDELLDLRIRLNNELGFKKFRPKREEISAEIESVDFLLSLRTHLEEINPESYMLIENSVNNHSPDN